LFKMTVARWFATTSRRLRRSNADSRSVKNLCSWIHRKISALPRADGFGNYRGRLTEPARADAPLSESALGFAIPSMRLPTSCN